EFRWIVLVETKSKSIRKAIAEVFRNSGPGLARRRKGRIGSKRNKVERAETDGQPDIISARANAGDDFAQQARPILKRAAIRPRSRVGAKKLVQQVPMTVFDVHEIRARFRCESSRANVILRQLTQFIVGEYLQIRSDAEASI